MDKPDCELNKCRTCLNETGDLQPLEKVILIEALQPVSYADLLKKVTNINVLDDKASKFPRSICNCCARKLKSSHTFIKQALDINDILWKNCPKLDCLLESEIEIQPCMEIKIESNDVEESCMDMVSPYPEEFKTEIPDQNSIESNINLTADTNTLQDSDDNDRPILGPEIEDTSSKKDSDSSESETDEEDLAATNDANGQVKATETSKKKHYPNENKDEDTDIAVPCSQCNKIFNNSKELSRHLRNTHLPEDQKCACPVCGIKFTRSCNMYKHMRKLHDPESVKGLLPMKEKPFACDKCHRRYTQKRQLNCHIKEKHKNGEVTSDTASSKLKSDSKKKPEVRPLCFVCGSSFSNKAHLIVHMTRHTGEKPHKCDLCDRAFPRVSDLTCHRRIHTGEKPFKCELCEKAFRVSTKLATHMRSHTNERPYKCKQCDRSFKYSKDLNIHMRVHTGERPYVCTVCGSTFTQSNSLKTHRMNMDHMEDGAP